MRRAWQLLCLVSLLTAGCAVRQLCDDEDKIRSCLLDLYTNQIMDNLIRASNGLPIIQIDYTNATAQVTVSTMASASESPAITRTNLFTEAAAASVAIGKTTMNTLMGSLSGSNANQVALTGTPVTTSNEVYDAYLAFLTLPGSLQTACEPPPQGAAHMCRRWGGKYYWVPVEFRREFLRLSLLTTAQRGKSLLPPDEFFTVSLLYPVSQQNPNPLGTIATTMKLDQAVPNDTGQIEFTLGDKTIKLDVGDYNPPEPMIRPLQTDQLVVFFNPKAFPPNVKSMKDFTYPISAKLTLRRHRPQLPPNTNQLLDRIQFQLQQIQFNQLR
jgi:hypothetical protein